VLACSILKAGGAANGTLPKVDPSFVPMIHVGPSRSDTRSKVPREQHAGLYVSKGVRLPSSHEFSDLPTANEQSGRLYSADLSDPFMT
jgi:hypothetical protein